MYRNSYKLGFLVLCFVVLAAQAGFAPEARVSDSALRSYESAATRSLLDKIFKEEKSNKIVNFIKNRKMKV